jgi:hypothetical protein
MPQQAFHELGDQLTLALIGGDFSHYKSLIRLPLRIAPRGDRAYILTTEAELRADFEAYCRVIQAQGVTDIYRQILDLSVQGSAQIEVRFLTHIMVRAHRIVAPFETQFQLRHGAEGWQISAIESSEGHIKWTLGQAGIADGQFNNDIT